MGIREKTTLRAAFRIGAKGWPMAVVMASAMLSQAVRLMMCAYAL